MEQTQISVVIVDDHEIVRESWKLILDQKTNILIVGECSSGAEAIDAATRLKPDVMLMDINMSPVNGFEATRKIVKLSPDTKIIGVSVNDQPGYARNMLQLGAKGYVTKNSTHLELLEAILEVQKGKVFISRELKDRWASDVE
ncbi:MAG TPA: response regulator transcription factor [Chitinophagaceae bacterium]|jgi:DNA-binding NarL/FixJ family response regulator|nr:response regulator transcription factor [Chitinophagaceae bacterium]